MSTPLKIKPIELTKPIHMRRLNHVRCSKTVRSTGTSYFNERTNQCGRLATFKINKTPFCTQHAGEKALKHLIKHQGGKI